MKTILWCSIFIWCALYVLVVDGAAQDNRLSTNRERDVSVRSAMVGAAEMTSVRVWLQTNGAAAVQVRFWERNLPATARLTERLITQPENDFVVRFNLSRLQMGAKYEYEIYVNGERVAFPFQPGFQTQPMWRFRSDPPAFKIAIGSCAYINDAPFDRPGKPYGGDYRIFNSIASQQPDAMLWLGDNVYLREADWLSENAMRYRYAHTRATPEMQKLLMTVGNYATWDDHDFGPNDSDRTFRLKAEALQVFKDYWANAAYGTPDTPGVFGRFEWGDAEFFLLDNRFYRSPNRTPSTDQSKTMWGENQFRWLQDALRSSNATFKIVVNGGQMLNPFVGYENLSTFPFEQQRLLDFLREAQIEGVLFLSGDRHHTELIRRDMANFYPLYEFTSSPLTSGGSRLEKEAANPARVPGTWITDGTRNFGTLEFSGDKDTRAIALKTFDADGKQLWSRTLKAGDLRLKK